MSRKQLQRRTKGRECKKCRQRREQAERDRIRDGTKKRMQKRWINEQTGILTGRHPEGSKIGDAQNGTDKSDACVAPLSSATKERKGGLRKQTSRIHAPKQFQRQHEWNRPSLETCLATDCLRRDDEEMLEGLKFDSDLGAFRRRWNLRLKTTDTRTLVTRILVHGVTVCAVGLRVYSKDQRSLCRPYILQGTRTTRRVVLDMDDPAASAKDECGSWCRRGV